jgi:tripartite-type tricarboxylate transporter receptor subunit TctC
LIDLAKAKPGELNYSGAATGSASNLAAELFKFMAGINIVHVPYKGSGPAVVDLVSGQVQVMFDGAPSLVAQIKAGRLRALAAASAKRNPLLPDLPGVEGAVAEVGHLRVEAASIEAANQVIQAGERASNDTAAGCLDEHYPHHGAWSLPRAHRT